MGLSPWRILPSENAHFLDLNSLGRNNGGNRASVLVSRQAGLSPSQSLVRILVFDRDARLGMSPDPNLVALA
jgi:hypothetical protein